MPENDFETQPIVRAVLESDFDLVRKLVAEGESLEAIDELAGPPLAAAIEDENTKMVALLLELGANPEGPETPSWDTPLSIAVFCNDEDAVKQLLQAGADPNHVRNDSIPLLLAVYDNDVPVAKLLIQSGADVYLKTRNGHSAVDEIGECTKALNSLLLDAAKQSMSAASLLDAVRMEAVDQVVKLAHAASMEELLEAAWLAMREEHMEVFQCLLENGLDPNAASESGYSLLHSAAGNQDKSVFLEWLLTAGADPNLRGTSPFEFEDGGATPLMLAANARKLSRVKLLLKSGADASLRDANGETALSLAKKAGGKTIIKLLEKLRDQQAKDSPAAMANIRLSEAVRDGDLKVVSAILAAGADINEIDVAGRTPLMEAISHNDVAMTEFLLENGADLLIPWPGKHESAWTNALKQRSAVKMVEVLLKYVDEAKQLCETDDDEQELELWRAILALPKKNIAGDVTSMLIRHGVDANQRFANGATPLHVAAARADAKTLEMIPVLLAAGADPDAMTEPDLAYERRRTAEINEMEARGTDVSSLRKEPDQHTPRSALDLAKLNNKRVYDALREMLGSENAPGDRYDETNAVVKALKQASGEPGFVEFSQLLAHRLRSKPRAWQRRDGVLQFTAKLKELAGDSFDKDDDWLRCLEPLQDLAKEHGATLVYHEIPADARKTVRVLLAPTLDWASVVRVCGTNGVNYSISNRDVVNRLAEIRVDHPFQLQGSAHDFVAIRFEPTSNYQALNEALIALCPDMSDESPVQANELAEFYRQDGRCFLWWD